MDTEYILTANGELYHWGIRGQKWGIRRYQNKDGSLTPAGRKRYADETERLKQREKVVKNKERVKAQQTKLATKKAELDAREKALEEPKKEKKSKLPKKPSNQKKSIKDMTDEELREHINRMQLEKNYHDAKKQLAASNPQKVSAGKKFMTSLANDVVIPATKTVGKQWLEKNLKEKFGIEESLTDQVKKVENQYKKLEWETKIKDLEKAGTLKEKKEPKELSWEDKKKQQDYLKNMKSTQEAIDEYEEFMEERARRREQGDA